MNGLGAFIVIIVAAVLLALLGLALVRRTVPYDRWRDTPMSPVMSMR